MCHQNEVDQWLSQIRYKDWRFYAVVRTSDWLEPRREKVTARFYKEDEIPEYDVGYRTVAVPRVTINLNVAVPTIESIRGFPTTFTHAFVLLAGSKEKFYRDVFDTIVKVETHEAMEFFTVDQIQMFFPDHRISPYSIPHPMQFTPKEYHNGEYKKVPNHKSREMRMTR